MYGMCVLQCHLTYPGFAKDRFQDPVEGSEPDAVKAENGFLGTRHSCFLAGNKEVPLIIRPQPGVFSKLYNCQVLQTKGHYALAL